MSRKKMAEKCQHCCRKTHFTITCKCQKVLCIEHRDPNDHRCKYDHKAEWTAILIKQNPVVVKQKIEVI